MSYNITSWKLKKLENFQVPLNAFYKHEREDWHPEKENHGNGIKMTFLESEWSGDVWSHIDEGEFLEIKSIDCSGEGSGATMGWILEPAFKESKGELVVVCIWEGGDSISELTVKDGAVSWKEIEL